MKIFISLISVLFLWSCNSGTKTTATASKIITTEKNFIEQSDINTFNPDRGFYYHADNLNYKTSRNIFQKAKDNGFTLAYTAINLSEYIHLNTLPNDLINTINDNLTNAEELGVKLILRLKYRNSTDGEDPSIEIVQSHLSQLAAILQNHKEIISVVQAGIIGAWGEWHTFTGDYVDTNINYKENRKVVIKSLLEIFPDKFIQIRTPAHKELLYGSSDFYQDEANDAKITEDIAFTNDIKAKIGHHNDCFISSETDKGTYPSDNIDFWKNYVINDSKYSPVGGETCEDIAELSNCENSISQLKLFKWSFLNSSYHPDVIQRWKDNQCYQEIQENLGYRLVAEKLTTQKSESNFTVSLDITNKGYSAPYIKSTLHFTLENNTSIININTEDIDLRNFQPEEVNQMVGNISIENIPQGEYCLYLKVGQSYSSIRLSNSELWDEDRQSNKLMCNIIF